MAEPAVVNASPLIYLARGGCFDLLQVLVERMRRSGMYLSDSVMNSALAIVGE